MFTVDDKYYKGWNLLESLDADGNVPGIFLSNSNRSAGKTTFYLSWLLDRYKENGLKFLILCRNKNELDSVDVTFDDVLHYYFDGDFVSSKWYVPKLIQGLYFNDKLCGYAVSLKDAGKLKKYSGVFADVDTCFMDELQPDNGRYIKDETDLMSSLIMTVSRGGGEQSRYVRWIWLSNNISIMNPYFLNMGIYRMIPETINYDEGDFYLRGTGWVAEFSYNKSAVIAMSANPALNALKTRNSRIGTSADFMINSNSFVLEKLKGKSDYLWTLKYNNKYFGVRRSQNEKIVYVTKKYDPSFKTIIALTNGDHNEITIALRKNTFYMETLRQAYDLGLLRFSDLEVKNDIIELLGIDLYR